MSGLALTIASEIEPKLEQLFMGEHSYMSEQSQAFLELSDEIDKLGRVDACMRSLLRARLYALSGNRDEAEYFIRNAQHLNAQPGHIIATRLMVLLRLAYFTEALQAFQQLTNPDLGMVHLFVNRLPGIGAPHVFCEITERAKEMGFIVSDVSGNLAAARVMDDWGDTDQEYARVLDIAGKILRERKLVQESMRTLAVPDVHAGGPGYVKLSCNVHVDLDTAIEMTCDFADRLAASQVKIPQSLVFEFEAVE